MITEVCTQYHYVLHILQIFYFKKNIKLALCYMKIGKFHPIKVKFDMHFTIQASQQNFIPLKMICLLLMVFPFIFQASSLYIVFLDNSS